MRNKMMTKILTIDLIFISKKQKSVIRPKEIQEEWTKNLNTEENSKLNLCYPYN